MEYLELTKVLRRNNLSLFCLKDIEYLFPQVKIKALKNNLSRWVGKGYFYRLKRDLYEFTELGEKASISDLYIANKLYAPSYVSLESALSIYNIIPETAAQATSITTRATRIFKNKYGVFFYHTCKKEAFLGYKLVNYEGKKVLIAEREKALVDFLYFRLLSQREINFKEERFDEDELKKLRWRRVLRYAGLYGKKMLKLARALKEQAKC